MACVPSLVFLTSNVTVKLSRGTKTVKVNCRKTEWKPPVEFQFPRDQDKVPMSKLKFGKKLRGNVHFRSPEDNSFSQTNVSRKSAIETATKATAVLSIKVEEN